MLKRVRVFTENANTAISHLNMIEVKARYTTTWFHLFLSQYEKAILQKIVAKVLGNGLDI